MSEKENRWTTDASLLLPFFGMNGRDSEMAPEMPKSWIESWLTLLLIGFIVFGISCVVGAEYLPHLVASPVRELGSGVITTGLLGLTVHTVLEYRIARDVFLAAFHYVLPTELRDEINRIISYRLLASDAFVSIKIDHLSDKLVSVETKIERTVKNMSRSPEMVQCVAAADEWGFPNFPSEATRCEMRTQGGELMLGDRDPDHNNSLVSVGLRTDKYVLPPGKSVRMVSQMRETHRENGAMELNLPYVHIKPRVIIHTGPGINYTFDFGVPGTERSKSLIEEVWTLDGTYFPGQRMRVRWWPTAGAGEPGSLLGLGA